MAAVSIVGLDIGSTSIRALEATRTKDRPVITNFGLVSLPEGTVESGVIRDEKAITNALRQLWIDQKLVSKCVVLGVSHSQMVVREVEVANLPPKELKQALPFQVKEVLPLPVEQAQLDFFPLEDPGDNEKVRGLLAAAPKEVILKMVRAVERAGLFVEAVDLACFATLRAAAHLAADSEAVVDIGAHTTDIIIHTDGVPKLVRTISRGGHELTQMMAGRLDLPLPEAETLKCRIGLIKGEGPEASDIITEGIRPLINEIRGSFNYFVSANPTERVKRLALVGGGALLPGLADRLSDLLGVPAFLPDPLQRVNDPRRGGKHDALGRLRASAAVSIGLTLGAA